MEYKMNAIRKIEIFQIDRNLHANEYNWSNEAKNILEELFEAKGYDIPKEYRSQVFDPILAHAEDLIGDIIPSSRPVRGSAISTDESVDAFGDVIVFAVGAIMKLGYDPEKVLQEVAKEINSRVGSIIDGKFEKDLSDEARANWYKADFTNCKI
jgi:hypothetical protein